jgi:hypothetical protein
MLSIVTAMRAAIGGGMVRTAHVAKSWMRFVTAVVPELRRPAEAVQLDHRQREVESEFLCLLDDRLVEIEGRHVLRRGRADQPTVVTDGDEYAQLHCCGSCSGYPKHV